MRHTAPEIVTPDLLTELHRISPYDPDHLPSEIELIESVRAAASEPPPGGVLRHGVSPDMPRVAKLLPIPRRYDAKGVQRYGFHGLSYAYLMEELARLGDPAASAGRVILAHLGNGASLAAVRDGKSIDTSMGFTPTRDWSMGTRSGDLDPGLAPYLARTEQMTANAVSRDGQPQVRAARRLGDQFRHARLAGAGSRGRPGGGSRRAVLLSGEEMDRRVRRCARADWTRSSSPEASGRMRPRSAARICEGLGFLGIELDARETRAEAPA